MKASRGRIRDVVAAVAMLLVLVFSGMTVAAPMDRNALSDPVQRPFYANVLYFRADNPEKTWTEVYVEIPYVSLAFVRTSSDYEARVEVAVNFDNAAGIETNGNTITKTIRTQDYAATLSRLDSERFYFPLLVAPGRYTLRFRVTDENTGVQIPGTCRINVPTFQNPQLQISSLKLTSDLARIATDSTPPSKDHILIPNFQFLFARNLSCFIYFETYFPEPAVPHADSFQVCFSILRNGQKMHSSTHRCPKFHAYAAVNAKLNLRKFEPGSYLLQVTVIDQNGKRRADKTTQFYVIDALYELSKNQI